MINKTIYFIFFNLGLSLEFGQKPFGLIHFLSIKSAKIINDCDVVLYYENEIENNVWWEESKKYCTHIKCNAPNDVFGNPLPHITGKSDVLRLKILNEFGGIYLDIDTICVKPFDDLLNHQFVMGKEFVRGETLGLCNAVMMGEKKSKFGELWLEEYKNNFDPRWGYMCVRKPYQISINNPETISIQPHTSFFKYTWTPEDLVKMHKEIHDISDSYVLHLWEQVSFNEYLTNITVDYIKNEDTTYNIVARQFI